MEIWQIVLIVLIFGAIFVIQLFQRNYADKNKIEIPLFSNKQLNESLKQRGPQDVADALKINRGGYDFGWNNVLKAASILGDASENDRSEAVSQLLSNLEVDEPNLVAISSISLGKLKEASAVPYLEKLLNSQPSRGDLEREKSLNFSKTQSEDFARRSGATLTNYPKIPNVTEQHQKIREAAAWAIDEIKREQNLINEKNRDNLLLDISQAFNVINNPKNYNHEIFLRAIGSLSQATGKDLPKARELLISNFKHADENVTLLSIMVLGQIGDKSVIDSLKQLLVGTPEYKANLRNTISSTIDYIIKKNK